MSMLADVINHYRNDDRDGVMIGFRLDQNEVFVGTGPQDIERATFTISPDRQLQTLEALAGIEGVVEWLQHPDH